MFVWAPIPEPFQRDGLARVLEVPAAARRRSRCRPGIGFGEYGEGYVRFALIENEHRTRQAVRGIRKALGGALDEARAGAQRRLTRARGGGGGRSASG